MCFLSALVSLTRQRHIAPFYHAISNAVLPHVRNLYTVRTEKEFCEDLDTFLKYFEPISVSDWVKCAEDQVFPKKNTFLLSFDDGHRECFDVVAPILEKKGIPAIFFVNSGFVDNRALFYRYKVSLCIETLRETTEKDSVLKALAQILGIEKKDKESIRVALLELKHDQENIIAMVANKLSVSFDDFLQQVKPYLTSPQIQNLLVRDFEIGAHSVSHPHYYEIPIAAQIQQTEESLVFLENNFGVQSRYFSFPFTDFGVKNDFFRYFYPSHSENRKISLSFGCAGLKNDTERFHFQRIPMEGRNQKASEILTKAYLYYCAKAFLGKNTIYR